MLNSGKKIVLCATKKINILKKILNETKNHNPPPCKLNDRSLRDPYKVRYLLLFSVIC